MRCVCVLCVRIRAAAAAPAAAVVVWWLWCFDDKRRRSTTRGSDVRTLVSAAANGSPWRRQGVCAGIGPIRPWPGLIVRFYTLHRTQHPSRRDAVGRRDPYHHPVPRSLRPCGPGKEAFSRRCGSVYVSASVRVRLSIGIARAGKAVGRRSIRAQSITCAHEHNRGLPAPVILSRRSLLPLARRHRSWTFTTFTRDQPLHTLYTYIVISCIVHTLSSRSHAPPPPRSSIS